MVSNDDQRFNYIPAIPKTPDYQPTDLAMSKWIHLCLINLDPSPLSHKSISFTHSKPSSFSAGMTTDWSSNCTHSARITTCASPIHSSTVKFEESGPQSSFHAAFLRESSSKHCFFLPRKVWKRLGLGRFHGKAWCRSLPSNCILHLGNHRSSCEIGDESNDDIFHGPGFSVLKY